MPANTEDKTNDRKQTPQDGVLDQGLCRTEQKTLLGNQAKKKINGEMVLQCSAIYLFDRLIFR